MKHRVFYEEFDSLYYFHGSTQKWEMGGFHFHNQYEIILFLNDGATLEIGTSCYHIQAGDLFLINNKEYHRTIGIAGKPYNRYVLMFAPELLEHLSLILEYDFSKYFTKRPENFIHRLPLTPEMQQKIEHKLQEIGITVEESNDTKEKRTKIILSILELLMVINNMYDFFTSESTRTEEQIIDFKSPILVRDRIGEIKKFVKTHVEDKLELDEIAREFYISRYYLSHYFKKETGFTLLQYVTNQKVSTAKILLKKGVSVADVAMKLSYNSDSHFIAVFKKNTGITPKKYALEHAKK